MMQEPSAVHETPFSRVNVAPLKLLPRGNSQLPAADPLVLAVDGTKLTANDSTGAYIGETTMGLGRPGGPGGSGGGFSHRYARPAYQDGVPGIATTRGVPDVAGAGAGSLIPIAFADGGKTYIMPLGGTSASAPLWGGLMALADQYAHHDLGFVNPAIYRIARRPSYHKAFHDVTTGNNTVTIGSITVTGYQAAPRLGPGNRLGIPQRARAHPPAGPLNSHRTKSRRAAERPDLGARNPWSVRSGPRAAGQREEGLQLTFRIALSHASMSALRLGPGRCRCG
jgi:hypothetical protein